MGYPVRIRIEDRIIQITSFKLIRSIKNRLHFVVLFYFVKPQFKVTTELIFVLASLLDIEYGRKVT